MIMLHIECNEFFCMYKILWSCKGQRSICKVKDQYLKQKEDEKVLVCNRMYCALACVYLTYHFVLLLLYFIIVYIMHFL